MIAVAPGEDVLLAFAEAEDLLAGRRRPPSPARRRCGAACRRCRRWGRRRAAASAPRSATGAPVGQVVGGEAAPLLDLVAVQRQVVGADAADVALLVGELASAPAPRAYFCTLVAVDRLGASACSAVRRGPRSRRPRLALRSALGVPLVDGVGGQHVELVDAADAWRRAARSAGAGCRRSRSRRAPRRRPSITPSACRNERPGFPRSSIQASSSRSRKAPAGCFMPPAPSGREDAGRRTARRGARRGRRCRGSWVTSTTVLPCAWSSRKSASTSSPVLRVEGAGGLVGEQQRRPVGERAGDRHALALAAGELAGQGVRPCPEMPTCSSSSSARCAALLARRRRRRASAARRCAAIVAFGSRLYCWKTKPIFSLRIAREVARPRGPRPAGRRARRCRRSASRGSRGSPSACTCRSPTGRSGRRTRRARRRGRCRAARAPRCRWCRRPW